MNFNLTYRFKILLAYLRFVYLLYFNRNCKRIFIFPFYHIGGAEKVHLEIVKSFEKRKTICIFNHSSSDKRYLKEFKKYSHVIESSILSENRLINYYYEKSLVNYINNTKKKLTLFGCNSVFFYSLLPKIKNDKVKKIDLLHAFSFPDVGIENTSINYVDKIDKRVIINKKTLDDYAWQYRKHDIDKELLKRIHIIQNGISLRGEKKSKNNTKLKIAFVGRDSAEKRLYLFNEVAKRLQRNFDFCVAGNNKLSTNYSSAGKIDSESGLSQFYKEVDILLVTSYREGFPLVIMEAMSHGVVCISTDVGSISEHVINFETGFTVENSTDEKLIIENLIEKIRLLNDDRELLKKLSENVYNYSIKNFDIKTFQEKYKKLFNE